MSRAHAISHSVTQARAPVRETAARQNAVALTPPAYGIDFVDRLRPQTRLKVGAPNDKYEQQADRVADAIMRMPAPIVQTKCTKCEEPGAEREALEGLGPAEEEIDGLGPSIQRQLHGEHDRHARESQSREPSVSRAAGDRINAMRGGGRPLDPGLRAFMEPRFGIDFSGVRVHTDERAVAAAEGLQARAFTLGRDIVFGRGEYQPSSTTGKSLLAHELTHVVQQTGGRSPAGSSGQPSRMQPALAPDAADTIQQAPEQIQRLSVSVVSPLTPGACGGTTRIAWDFTLGSAAPADGYLVQHVRNHEHIENCPTAVDTTPANPTFQFWEAWPVNKGATRFNRHADYGLTDISNRPIAGNTSATSVSRGEIKFFTRAVTGDLGGIGTAPADGSSPWRPGGVPRSGVLPSVANQPAWWTQAPTEGPVSRWRSAWWNCCDPVDNQFVRVDADPK